MNDDLMLLYLKDQDGISVSKEILFIDSDTKIILTTAFNEQGFIENSKVIGIESYVNKSINISKLHEKIEVAFASVKI